MELALISRFPTSVLMENAMLIAQQDRPLQIMMRTAMNLANIGMGSTLAHNALTMSTKGRDLT